jgi:hypothetical protein
MKKIILYNIAQKESWSSYINFKKADNITRDIISDKKRHYMIIKESILQEMVAVIKLIAPNRSVKTQEVKMGKSEKTNRQVYSYG